MKRIAYSLIALAIAAFTFTSCEDVPSPFGTITDPDNGGGQETVEPAGDGTAANPYNVAGVLEFIGTLGSETSDKDVYVKGIIVEVKEAFGTQYGNATFTMADTESSKQVFTFYRGKYLGNQPYKDENATNIKVGDKVIICGKVMMYGGNTPETSQGNAYVVSINDEGGDTPTPQPSGEVVVATVAEFNAAPESTDVWYQLTGIVKNLKDDDQYGNFDIEDETGSAYVYGLLAEKGGEKKKFQELAAAKGIKNGVKITIIGNRSSYNNKIQVANAYFVKVEEGGTPTPQPGGEEGNGTVESPYNVAAALAAAANLPEINNAKDANESNSLVDVVVKGVITNIKSIDTGQYGNAEYTISDDTNASNALLVYRGYGLNGEKFTSESIKVGDEVTIQGTIVNFKGTIEFTTGSKILSIASGGSTPSNPSGNGGTVDNPYNVAEALAAAANLPEINSAKDANESNSLVDVVVKGVITNIKSIDTGQYGNAEYTISDDTSASNALLVYRGYGLNGEKFTSESIKLGDKVTVQGTIVNFKGTIEFTTGSKILSIQ